MRRVSMATRDELVAAVVDRYARSGRTERGRILDEFVAVTGHHRKHAMRLLRGGKAAHDRRGQRRGRVYDAAVHEALIVLWEASDRVCGKRLRPLLPVLVGAMERHGHLQLAPVVRTGVLAMSAATIDRALRAVKDPAAARNAGARHHPRRCGGACRCGPSRTGRTRLPGSSRRTWWRTAGRHPGAATCRLWC